MGKMGGGKHVAPVAYVEQLRKSYKSLASPERHFVLDAVKAQPFEQVLVDLMPLGPVADDTDINCDVCFTFALARVPPVFIKLSMVGPFAAVLLFGRDGLTFPADLLRPPAFDQTKEAIGDVFPILERHGFIFPSMETLESRAPIDFAGDGSDASLYAALFEPEGEAPWGIPFR